jgi:coproporphyrinogen III oxidase-like Fe-S oxidoreductase
MEPPPHHLYVHVPFCRLVCAYCDFVTVGGRADDIPRYVRALLAELTLRPAAGELRTIYFGGGTPSLLSGDQVAAVIEAATDRWAPTRVEEITLEANPSQREPAGGRRQPHQPRGPVAARR